MSLRALPAHEAAPLIACVLAAIEKAAGPAPLPLASVPFPRGFDHEAAEAIPCAADFGLTAREAGAWGRLRATGLSDADAANVVKTLRPRSEP